MTKLAVHDLVDRKAREDALDISCSCIVQAPAGSGKTELLALRFLKLLAIVEEPEQVLGITFAKAATAEIRHRIVAKLEMARSFLETRAAPEGADYAGLEIATAAYTNSNRRGWGLLEQPHRLDIQTIDSLGLRIAHQMPLSGRPGGLFQPTTEANPLYRKAARKTLDRLGGDDEALNAALRGLLLLRDSNLADCEALLAKMLATRDQWTRAFPLTGEINWAAVRQQFEEPFRREIDRVLGRMHAVLSSRPALSGELMRLANYACSNSEGLILDIQRLQGMSVLPSPTPEFVEHWRCFVELLLTNKDEPRRAYTTGHGFPPGVSEKAQMLGLVRDLSEIPGFTNLLAEIRGLPLPGYTDRQWINLCHILMVLRQAAAKLKAVFVEQGVVDFVELGTAALDVLRDDARGGAIQHLLVDEFQDTSRSQHQLIAALLRSWDADTSGDYRRTLFDRPRTVFLVGDPMQSIYMFRQADVELFEQVRKHGFDIGTSRLSPDALGLKTNFRSHAGLVNPLNKMFETIFPHGVQHASTDVEFLPAAAWNESRPQGAYQVHTKFTGAGLSSKEDLQREEADEVIQIIRSHLPAIARARERGNEFTIAVLGRARKHLVFIAAALRKQGIAFRALDLELLGERQEILDMQSIHRALLHPMDRVAWLALLRAPWCGLHLSDLHLLCDTDAPRSRSGPASEEISQRLSLLSDDPRRRVERLLSVMRSAIANRHRQASFSAWIERTWNSLGGPSCVDAAEYENVQVYLRMLDKISLDGIDASGEALREQLNSLYAQPDPAVSERCGVQLMTIHKAKGLGFNVVLVPGLERETGKDSNNLLRYLERSTAMGMEFLLAPIGGKGDKSSSIYTWVQRQIQNRQAEELKRLLYVACTRARQELHLFATAKVTNTGLSPAENSLLKTAWPALQAVFAAEFEKRKSLQQNKEIVFPASPAGEHEFGEVLETVAAVGGVSTFHRLRPDWKHASQAADIPWAAQLTAAPAIADDAAQRPQGSRSSRILGTTVHVLFERVVRLLARGRSAPELLSMLPEFHLQALTLTRNQGLPPQEVDDLAGSAVQAVEEALADPAGLWILGPRQKAQTEASWTGMVGGAPRTLRIDRSFLAGPEPLLDDPSCLWIIDYKTANHSQAGSEEFFDAEKRAYAVQLESYAEILRLAYGEETQVRLGLYYPFVPRLVWWRSAMEGQEVVPIQA
jgi:ATP-dependent helicase/nuclease subunit A